MQRRVAPHRQRSFRLTLTGLLALIGVATIGCEVDADLGRESTGRRAAARVSKDAAPPVPVRAFDRHLRAACPPDETRPTLADVTLRQPYLQRVGPDSAMLTWTATTDHPMHIEVYRPDGDDVATSLSTLEPTHYLQRGHQHIAMVAGLEPATIYCYTLLDDRFGPTSPVGFRTAPAPDADAPLTFIAIGDMGNGSEDQSAVAHQVHTVAFDLMLVLGDNAYESGTVEEYERHFFDVYAEVFSSVPLLPISGNHEYRTDDAAPFRELFSLPDNGVADADEHWYSFDVGNIHFVGLDSEVRLAEQAAWLDEDLTHNDRPWTIVMMHRPPWSSGHHGSHSRLQAAFGEVFARHRVPLVLSGHEHSYERTLSLDGTVYVVSGGGGRETRPVGHSWFTAFSEEVLHYVWLHVDGNRLELRAVDATGTVFDSLVIER